MRRVVFTHMKKLIKSIVFISALFSLIALINKLLYKFVRLNDRLGHTNSFYYQWKFGQIYYTKTGAGPAVLLIHSMENGASSYEYSKIIKSLSKKYTVFAIDLLGYGRSEKPRMTYTAYLYVQLITDFMTNVIKEPVSLITSGKTNAYATIVNSSEAVSIKKIIFINPAAISTLSKNPSTRDKLLKYTIESPIIGTLIYHIISSRPNISYKFKKEYFYQPLSYKDSFVEAFFDGGHIYESNNKYIFSSNLCNYTNVKITSHLRKTNTSIYLIQGSDRNTNHDIVSSSDKKENSSIESSVINKTKEFPHIENPKALLEVITVFLHENLN